jgi:hypothetical protein
MRAHPICRTAHAGGVLLLSLTLLFSAFGQEVTKREITRTKEKELTVSLSASFGTLVVGKGDRDKIVVAEYWRDEDEKQRLEMSYDIVRDRGDLDIELTESNKFVGRDSWAISKEEHRSHRGDYEDRHLTVRFTDAIPIAFNISLGAGKGDFDFSGLQVKRLKISAGASSADLRCDDANSTQCEDVIIESGVSRFSAENLCNLNFRRLKFSGGVGSYKLDFGGELQRNAEATVELGLGAVTVYVPRTIATRVIYDESWFSSIDLDDSFVRTKKSIYETEDFPRSDKTLTIKISSGLGTIKVKSR